MLVITVKLQPNLMTIVYILVEFTMIISAIFGIVAMLEICSSNFMIIASI